MSDVAGRISRGLAWPLRVDERGSIALDVGVEDIHRSIRAILATAPGERLMRLDFGCGIWQHLRGATDGDTSDAGTITAAADAVREALTRWEGRIDLLEVSVAQVVPQGDGDPIAVLVRATGERADMAGLDVDVEFVERATSERFAVAYRCVLTTDDVFVLRRGQHDARDTRIVLTKRRGNR